MLRIISERVLVEDNIRISYCFQDRIVLEQFIAHRCHNGSIICMETSGRYLATGGGDDRIVIIDLKLNRDVHVSIFRLYFASVNKFVFLFQ